MSTSSLAQTDNGYSVSFRNELRRLNVSGSSKSKAELSWLSRSSPLSGACQLIAFYRFLMDEEVCLGNPAQLAKKDCRYLMKDSQVKATKRLTETQWQFLLQCALSMADEYERYVVAQ